MNEGFILLSRAILDSDVFASQKLLKIWIWCLCKANFKDRSIPLKIGKGETIVRVKRGSFIFGRFKAEEELFIDGSTVYKSMNKLKEMNMINIDSNNQYSIVTICKYDEYQQSDNYKVTTKGQLNDNQVTTKEQPSNTTKNANKDNNEKNDNNEIDIYPTFNDFWDLYDKKTSKAKTELKWNKLKQKDKELIIDYLPNYINAKPDKQFRKDPITFLNNESWNDELIINNKSQKDEKRQFISQFAEAIKNGQSGNTSLINEINCGNG